MKICAFDLETIADPSAIKLLPDPKPDGRLTPGSEKYQLDIAKKRAAQIDNMPVNPHQNIICAASWYASKGDNGYILLEDEQSEKKLLNDSWGILSEFDYFITFYGIRFDVPCLTIHSMRHRVRPCVDISTHRYNSHNQNHLDCYSFLSAYGKRKGVTLDYCLKYFGIAEEGKGDIDGSMVKDMWQAGEKEKIGKYCLGDSRKTFELGTLIREFLF